MIATRKNDILYLGLGRKEMVFAIDPEVIQEAIASTRESDDEEVLGYTVGEGSVVTLKIHLDIAPAPGESDRDVYLRENRLPFV
jgi:hypothetical protein